MVSKNNIEIKKRRLAKQVPHYGLRRLSVGVASVLLGTSFYLGGIVAHADTTTGVQPTVANTEENSNNSAGSLTFSTSTSGSSSNAKTIAAPTSTVSASAASNTSTAPAANTAANSADSSSSAPAVKTPAASSSAVSANNGNSASSSASSTSSSANFAAAKKINVNDLKQADFGAAAALNTNLTQTSDDTTVVKPSAPITDDSFKGQTLDENKALVGTGKQASIQLSDGSSLSIDNNVIDPNKNTAILTFKSNSFKAGDSYQIVIDKNHGITLSETDIAKLQPSFGTTVFKETADQYIITDHFINDGTISQAIKLSYGTSTSLPWSFAKMTANISVVKNSDSSSIKTLPVNVIAPELKLKVNSFTTPNMTMVYNHHDVDLESISSVTDGRSYTSFYDIAKNINTVTVQIAELPQYFTATSCSINLDGTSISVPIVNGKAIFTREQLDKLLINGHSDNGYSDFFIFAIHGRFDVPDNLFTHSKYISEFLSDVGTVNLAYKNNYGSLNSSTSLISITVLDGNAKLTAGDVLGYNQDCSAYFADNDYSKGGISAYTIPVIGNGATAVRLNENAASGGADFISYYLKNNLTDELHNVTWHISIPDGLNLNFVIGGPSSSSDHYQVIVTLRNGKRLLFNNTDLTQHPQQLEDNIASIDVTIPDIKGGEQLQFNFDADLKNLISNTYANGTPTQPGDLIVGSSTFSADGYGSVTVDNKYIRLVDHSVPNKKGVRLEGDPVQTDKTPGTLNCGHWIYKISGITSYNVDYDLYLKKPVFYIQVPENAVLQDLSKVTVCYTTQSDSNYLKPKSISLLTIGEHQFIKVDLSNYNVFNNNTLTIRVDYSNVSDIQSSSKKSPFLIVSDSLTDSEQDLKANHFDLNSTDDVDAPFKQLVKQEGIDPADTAYENNGGGTWDILTSDGMTSATMTKGNVASGPSMDSTQNDHKDQADTFNLYGSIIDATDQSIPSSVQVINVPTTSDGHSQFDTHLSGPIHVIDAVTGKNLDSLAKITYSESAANLSASAKGIPSDQLTADQVTDWSKIKSITIRMDVPKRTSARAVLTMKDPQIYDHVGKTVYVASTVFSDANDTSGTYHLKPITIAAGSAASAKLTVDGQSTVKTIVHYKDDKGDHYIELPDKAKTYNELQGTMNRSDFLQSASDLTDADRILLPAGMVLDYTHPTIKNSNEKYLDNYQNGTAAFGQKVKYDFDQDAVVFEGAMPIQVTDTKTVTETIHYVYENGPKAGQKAADDVTKSVEFSRVGFKNPFTGEVKWAETTDSKRFDAVQSPEVKGYTPDTDQIAAVTVNPDSQNVDRTVTYAPDVQKLDVKFIDDSDNGKVLKTVAKSGATNADAGYNTQSDIDSYKSQHYVLVSDSSNGQALKFDDQTGTDQHYEVHLKHNTHAISEHHTVNETVHYAAADGSKVPADHTADVQFDRDGFNDEVTGTDHWNAWTPSATQKFAEVPTPVKKGYTPDVQSVDAVTVNPTDQDVKRTVTYAPDAQKLDVKFIDDTTGKALKTVVKNGVTNADAKYSTQSDIDSYKSQHYVLVSDSSNGAELVFDDDDTADQHYTVHLKHATHAINEHHVINETVHYKMSDGTKAPADYQAQALSFSRDGFNDEVTGTDHWNAWTPKAEQTFDKVVSPVVAGYAPDIDQINAQTVKPTDTDLEFTVTYTPNVQLAHVKYIDDTDHKVLTQDDLSGRTGETSGYHTADRITEFKGQHYDLVSDDYPADGITFDNDDRADQNYEVHFKHGTRTDEQDVSVPRTIKYVYQNGQQAQPDHSDALKFHETKVVDLVDGHTVSDDWTPAQDFKTIETPAIQGYTPDHAEVANAGIAHDHAAIAETVTYNPDAQKAAVKYIDDTTGEQLEAKDLTGVSDQSTGYSTKDTIDGYINQHYVLVRDDTDGKTVVFDHDDQQNQSYEVHLKHGTEPANESRTKKITVHYQYADGLARSGKAADDQTVASLTFKRTGTHDLVTDKTAWNAWDHSAQTFAEIDSPAIEGYTSDQAKISNVSVTPDSPEMTEKTVVYHADAQKLSVDFIDDTTGKTLKTVAKIGHSDESAGYSTKSDLQSYLAKHYDLVSDQTNGESLVFDHDDKADQHYEVHLIHHLTPINEQHTITETVHYQYADGLARSGKAADDYHADALKFSRTGSHDNVTDSDHWNAWTPADQQTFAAVQSPAIEGYTPDQAQIDAVTIDPDSQNIEKTVTYTADAQKLTVNFIDDTTGKTLKTIDKDGHSDEAVGYNTKSDLQSYLAKHYDLVSDDTQGQDLIFDHDDSQNQVYNVHLSHHTHKINEQHTVAETIHYVYADGLARSGKAADDFTADALKFSRDGFNDEVTGVDHWNAWTPADHQMFAAVQSPAIEGYTPDQAQIDAVTVDPDSQSIEKTVVYNADAQKLTVNFIDDTTGKTLKTISKDGHSDEAVGYNTKSDIQNFAGQHYDLVSDATNGADLVFDHNDGADQAYDVHLSHHTHPINEQHTITETVHYQYADGLARTGKAADDFIAAPLSFSRDGFNDEVTGVDHWNAWTPSDHQMFAAVQSPAIEGYTPDQAQIDAAAMTPDSQSIEKTVTYSADGQKLTVNFIDDTTGKTLKTVDKDGHSDESAGYSTKSDLQSYLAKHYDLVSDDTQGQDLIFDHDDSQDQVYNVHLSHHTHKINDQQTVNETVHYKMSDGTKAPADYQAQALSFSRDGFNDEVTGTDHWNAWTPKAEQTFDKVVSPVVAGYAPDIDQINAQTVKPTDTDLEFTVTYTPNVQLAHVKYIDDTDHKVLTQDDLSGRTGETSGYHTADRITEFANQHYVFVSDNYPADGMTFDNNDKVDQNYEVHFKHGTRTDEQDVQVPRTIKYVYQNGQQAQPDHSDALKFHETKVVDLVDGHTVSDDWTPAQDFETVATPAIQGYTPDRAEVANAGIKHDHSAITETVTYNPDAQKAVVKYIDDTTGEQLEAKDLAGVSDQSTGYNTKETINGYINQHYVLVSDDTDGKTVVFDHDDRQNQSYEVRLKHDTEPANESRTKKITVHYQYADGLARSGKASDDQTVANLTFKRTGTHDLVTGKIAWNAWDQPAQTFDEIDSPVIEGYTPDQAKVNNVSVTADSPEMTEKTVVYHADAQKLSVDFIDDTTGKTLKTVNKIGHSDESTDYDTKSDIQDFISKHYDLISDQTNGENLVFDHDDKSDQTFEVHFKHGTQDASDSCTKTLIVHYQYADKKKAADDRSATSLTFTRKGTKDLVTGDTTWQAWDQPSQTFATVESPTIPGYTPDQTAIDGVAVNADSPAQTEKTVTYTADAQKATVTYIDDTTGKTLKTTPLNGKTNAKSGYTTANDIQTYENLGYTLVSDSTNGAEIVFDNDDKNDQAFEVHLKHGTMPVSETDTVTETIHYRYADGKPAQPDKIQILTIIKKGIKDLVNGNIVWQPVDSQMFASVQTPAISGYQANVASVPEQTVKFGDHDIEYVVTYYKVVESAPSKQNNDLQGTTGTHNEQANTSVDVDQKATSDQTQMLPQTGNEQTNNVAGIVGLALTTLGTLLGLGKKKRREQLTKSIVKKRKQHSQL